MRLIQAGLVFLLAVPVAGCGGDDSSSSSSGGTSSGGAGGSTNQGGNSGSSGSGGSGDSGGTSSGGSGGSGGSSNVDFTPGVVPDEAPDWVASLTPGVWQAISKNKIEDVDPALDPAANPNYPDSPPWGGNTGQHGMIGAWCGGAFAYGFGAYGSLLAWGGGHQDYYGNEIYAFDLGTLEWTRVTNPYPNPQFNGIDSYPEGHYPDGSPVPPHTSDMLEYHPGTNSFVTLQAELNNLGGYTTATPYMYSFEHDEWRRGSTSPEGLGAFGWSAYDTKRDVMWAEGGYSGANNPMSSFDPNGDNGDGTFGKWTNYEKQAEVLGSVGAYDPVDDAVIVTSFQNDPEIFGIDPQSPSDAAVVITETGDAPSRDGKHGWEWSSSRKSFVYWSGQHVYELLPPAQNWKTDAWTWVDITNPASSDVPEYAENGVYGRFRIANYGGVEVAITVNSTSGAVYAFRLPQ